MSAKDHRLNEKMEIQRACQREAEILAILTDSLRQETEKMYVQRACQRERARLERLL